MDSVKEVNANLTQRQIIVNQTNNGWLVTAAKADILTPAGYTTSVPEYTHVFQDKSQALAWVGEQMSNPIGHSSR